MKKSELRQIIREIIEEQAIDQFGGISGYSGTPDPQTMANIRGASQGLFRSPSYQEFIAANPDLEGQFGDAGTFNVSAWFNNFMPKVNQASNPCNFLQKQRQKLIMKYPPAGGKYKAQLLTKIKYMTKIASDPSLGCNLPDVNL